MQVGNRSSIPVCGGTMADESPPGSPSAGAARDEAMLDMETKMLDMEKLLAEVDGRLDGTDERMATEVAALRQAFENVKEAQEAVALDIIYMQQLRKDVKGIVLRLDEGLQQITDAAIAAVRSAVQQAIARKFEKTSPKANRTRRRSESPSPSMNPIRRRAASRRARAACRAALRARAT